MAWFTEKTNREVYRLINNTRGKACKVYSFVCWNCAELHLEYVVDGTLPQGRAQLWARERGWSKTKTGWLCPTCKAQRKGAKA